MRVSFARVRCRLTRRRTSSARPGELGGNTLRRGVANERTSQGCGDRAPVRAGHSRGVDLEILCGGADSEEGNGDEGSRERLHGERQRAGDGLACGKRARETGRGWACQRSGPYICAALAGVCLVLRRHVSSTRPFQPGRAVQSSSELSAVCVHVSQASVPWPPLPAPDELQRRAGGKCGERSGHPSRCVTGDHHHALARPEGVGKLFARSRSSSRALCWSFTSRSCLCSRCSVFTSRCACRRGPSSTRNASAAFACIINPLRGRHASCLR